MGAVMPSGRVLARTMAQYVDIDSDRPVIELGPGTGAITNALIAHGVDQKRLVLVEYNPGFCALLRDRYPQATVVQGDAYALRDSLWNVLSAPASAVVSGLPLVTKPMLTRLKLIRDAFVAMALAAVMDSCSQSSVTDQLFGRGEACHIAYRAQDRHRRQQPNSWQLHQVGRLFGPLLTGAQTPQFGINFLNLRGDVFKCGQILIHS